MAAPTQQLFGNIYLDGLKRAITELPTIVDDYQGKKNFKVKAAMWEDGSITLNVYNSETQQNIHIGKLIVSQFTNSKEDIVNALDSVTGTTEENNSEEKPF